MYDDKEGTMSSISLTELVSTALRAAEEACGEIMDVYSTGNFQTAYKDDASPLTIADKRAHYKIVDILCKNLPYRVLSEEGKHTPYEMRKEWKYFWLVDPLDGTKEFVKRNGEFTVNIAFVEDGVPVLGVMAVPVTGELYYGGRDIGAFQKKDGSFVALRKRDQKTDLKKQGLRVVASKSHMSPETKDFIDSLDNPQLLSVGSSLKFMLLAKGEADVYPRFGPTMEWDTAAAQAIIEPLGIQILKKGTTEPLRYNKPSLLNPDFLCM